MVTVFFGNGFNLLNNNGISWKELVHTVDDSKDKDKIPNTLQFEVQVDSSNNEYTVKKRIADSMTKMTTDKVHKLFINLLKLEADHFITTNYDYVPDNIIVGMKFFENKSKRDKSEAIYSIHRTICYTKKRKKISISGEFMESSNPKSILLGHNHYGSYLAQIKKYISGEYQYPKISGKIGSVPKMELRIPKPHFELISWIDLFFISDVYIIGFSLDYFEIDLWWILTIRQRLIKKLGKNEISNKIVFYGYCDSGKRQLLKSLDVHVFSIESTEFPKQYSEFIKDIKNKRIPRQVCSHKRMHQHERKRKILLPPF